MFWNGFLINFTFLQLHCTKKACVAGFTFPFTPICVFLSGHMIPSFWRHFHRDWCVVWLYFEVAVLVVIFVLAFAWNRLWCCIVVSFSDVNEKVWYAPAVLRFIAVLYFSCCLPGMLSKDAAVKVWPTSAQAVWHHREMVTRWYGEKVSYWLGEGYMPVQWGAWACYSHVDCLNLSSTTRMIFSPESLFGVWLLTELICCLIRLLACVALQCCFQLVLSFTLGGF